MAQFPLFTGPNDVGELRKYLNALVNVLNSPSEITGNFEVDGTLTVDGASTLTGNVHTAGTLTVDGASTLTGAATLTGGASLGGVQTLSAGPVGVYSGTAATRAAARAAAGNGAAIGSIFVAINAVATTKPNFYVKVANASADTDWERVVTQASD